jgi:hypothetical protein
MVDTKIRVGFVSNSSSSSFVIFGALISNKIFDEGKANWELQKRRTC